MTRLFAGLDVGTTNVKCCIFSSDGTVVTSASRPTPWKVSGRQIEMQSGDLHKVIVDVLAEIDVHITSPIEAFGITGMAEAGLILDMQDEALCNILAWNDSRPDEVVEELFTEVTRSEFTSITGLPTNSRATIAKLLWLQSQITFPQGARWVGVPEWVAFILGGKLVAERSLASRTGLYDILADDWRDDFQNAVFKTHFEMPELVSTQDILGRIDRKGSHFNGAALIVAGHDHMCAAIGTGESNSFNIVDSMGTGEALSREVRLDQLSPQTIEAAVADGITIGRHPLPGRYSAMVGLGSGLILKSALEIMGIKGEFEGNQATILHLSQDALSVVDGPVFNELDPASWSLMKNEEKESDARIWRGALDFVGRRAQRGVNMLDQHFGRHTSIVACGGWLRNEAITVTKSIYLGDFYISEISEPGCFGAAQLASRAAGFDDLTNSPTAKRLINT
jgi:sugar (pentulose or hexulose) kinase